MCLARVHVPQTTVLDQHLASSIRTRVPGASIIRQFFLFYFLFCFFVIVIVIIVIVIVIIHFILYLLAHATQQ